LKKASEYRTHAESVALSLAACLDGSQREQLLEMARTWDKLASERADLVRRHPDLAIDGERAEQARAS